MYTLKDDSVKLLVIQLSRDGYSLRNISQVTGIGKTTVAEFLRRETYADWWNLYEEGKIERQEVLSGKIEDPSYERVKLSHKRYVITSAQNNTYVNEAFFDSLINYCQHNNAEFLISTFTYSTDNRLFVNKTESDELWYDPRIKPFIQNNSCVLAKDLVFCGELDILPTAHNPLSGLENYTKNCSGIIPHTKIRLESIPSHITEPAKFLYSTGAVTRIHYIQRKAGQKAAHHHIYGALVVEIDDDGDWFVRQIVADKSGGFYDLDKYYTGKKVTPVASVEAINWGDIHFEKIDPVVALTSFGVKQVKDGSKVTFVKVDNTDSMLDVLKPKYQFCHDTTDFMVRNHHTIKDPHHRFRLFTEGTDSVEESMKMCADGIFAMSRDFTQTVIVESNHDLALEKWLKTADYREDPINSLYFLKLQTKCYEAIHNKNDSFNVFEYTMRDLNSHINQVDVKFLKADESFRLFGDEGIECGWHSHAGINGARGTAKSFTKVGIRANIGHSHSATIVDGIYQAGVTGLLNMGYNSAGASSWSHSHIVTYPNEKRTIVTIKNGKWRAK
jgi:hypothetical protein